jgi:hypothetical protein
LWACKIEAEISLLKFCSLKNVHHPCSTKMYAQQKLYIHRLCFQFALEKLRKHYEKAAQFPIKAHTRANDIPGRSGEPTVGRM